MRNQREGEFVLFVTKRGRNFLKKRFVRAVIVDLRAESRGFFLQPKLGGGIEHAVHAILRQISKRRLTTSRPRERNIRAEGFRQDCRIDSNLRNVPVRFRAREKIAIAFVDENVKDCFVECGIRGMAMQLPIAVDQIDFDATATRFVAVDLNHRIGKIGTGFAIPSSELDDVDLFAGGADEISAELAGEPARLELELVRDAEWKKKRPFLNARAREHFAIAVGAGGHQRIMRIIRLNVTRSKFIVPSCSTFV